MMRNKTETIGNLIDKQSTAFLSSVDSEGFPNTKAMLAPRKREGIRTFYFTTNLSSLRIRQFKENPKGCIYFCDKRFFRGVMLIGEVEILEDKNIKEEIWKDGDTKYYKGMDDPDYCVLRFTAYRRRYYSNFSSEDFDIE